MSSNSDNDSSDEIDDILKKKQRDAKQNKQSDNAEIKEEYQDDDEEEVEDQENYNNNDNESNSNNKNKKSIQNGQIDSNNHNSHSEQKQQQRIQQRKEIKIKASYSFHNNNPNHIITNEPNDVEWECFDCNKKYKSYPAFYTHNKIKHNGNPPDRYKIPRPLDSISKDRGRPKADTSTKQKFTDKDQRQHNLEDEIYEFLAKAGANDDQDNKIIRQYLNEPVNYIQDMPIFGQYDPNIQQNILSIQSEINKLVELIRQYDDFQYIDPMELSDPQDSEINLFNLKYLIQYYKQNNLITEYTLIAIFIAWIGKELRQDSYSELCVISIAYFTTYFNQINKIKNNNNNVVVQSNIRKDLLEKIHKNMEYASYLTSYSFKLFNHQSAIFDLIQQIKSWIIFWTESIYYDKNQANSFNTKSETPILLDDEDDEDENDDGDENQTNNNCVNNKENHDNNDEQDVNKNEQKNQENEQVNGDIQQANENLEKNNEDNQLENPEQNHQNDNQENVDQNQNSCKDNQDIIVDKSVDVQQEQQ